MSPRILLVDDEPEFRKLFQKILETENYHLELVADGKTALEHISQGGYDLILLDIIMPGMDGITVLKNLQNQPAPALANGQIIMLSVLEQTGFIKTCLTLGATGYINKSTAQNPTELLAQIKVLLKQK